MSRYKKELDNMIWSFSRIKTYEQCPYSFYLKYIEECDGDSNFYADNGKLIHKTLEKIFKGELSLDDAPGFYIDEFENICSDASVFATESLFNACLDFLCEYDFNIFNDYEVLGVEKECRFNVGKYHFRGYIDLLLRKKDTSEIVVWDHKSSAYPMKKDGVHVLKMYADKFKSYKHQMYLYSKQVIDEYKIKPSKITWLHFKDQKTVTIDFDDNEYKESLSWAENIIGKIYRDNKFMPDESYMFCKKLCAFRSGECEYLNEGGDDDD